MMKPKNKKIINNFCNYLLNLGFEDKMDLNVLLKNNLLHYVLLFGRRYKFLPYYNEIVGFKFKRKDYVKLSNGRKLKGICYVPACSTLGFIIDDGICWPTNIMTEDNWVQIIKNIWKEDKHI